MPPCILLYSMLYWLHSIGEIDVYIIYCHTN